MFCEMGHWYPWATREYILKKMNLDQFLLYYRHIPAEGIVTTSKESSKDKPDIKAIKKMMGGKRVLRR